MNAKLATISFAPLVLLVVGAVDAPVLDPAGLVAVAAAPVPVPEPVAVLLLAAVLNGMECVVVAEPVAEIPAKENPKMSDLIQPIDKHTDRRCIGLPAMLGRRRDRQRCSVL
jgi:hypothetical protein